jgi:hypothetical protein
LRRYLTIKGRNAPPAPKNRSTIPKAWTHALGHELRHGDVTTSSLSFACAAQYVAQAIKQHGRTVRAVGSGSGGINSLPGFRGQLLGGRYHGPFSRNAGT